MPPADNTPTPPDTPDPPPDRAALFAILATGLVMAIITHLPGAEVIPFLTALGGLYQIYRHL